MQVGGVADRGLRLVGNELDTVGMAEGGALHQAGDAAHFHDVGLNHADAAVDQRRHRLQGIRLLAGRHRDVQPLRDLAHRLGMVVLDGLLEPDVAEILEHPPDPDRCADRVAIVGVERQREVVSHQPAHGPGLGDVADDVAIDLASRAVPADLDRRRLFRLEPRLDRLHHAIDVPGAIVADRGVERDARSPRAAKQLVDRLPERLALQVPKGDIDRRKSPRHDSVGAELDQLVQQAIEDDGVVERVGSDQRRRHVARDDGKRRHATLHG